ncbi:MAG: hypothetical protein GTO55_05535 [Armatimonadetes bacterium]|nr:hypothetical protein [Armatimonadota bacterium]NIM23719.1 hypothetical protein [Armatimonadota bacterium]NIM67596.1 hypothetical protein [Armatimonadota bacterium]NIM76119.1 hypothetical protein [Armatimonadota bacterium]NIN05802.1 hypothetical protein [Armatimonadota bacterium]
MDERLLRVILLLAYAPFFTMLAAFGLGLILKWSGDSSFLDWLTKKTDAQKPLPRKPQEPHTDV